MDVLFSAAISPFTVKSLHSGVSHSLNERVQFKLQPCTVVWQAFLLMLIVPFAMFHSHLPNHPVLSPPKLLWNDSAIPGLSMWTIWDFDYVSVPRPLLCFHCSWDSLCISSTSLFLCLCFSSISAPSQTITSFIGGKLTAGLWRFSSITVLSPVLCSSASRSTVALQCHLTTRRHKASNSCPWSHKSTVVVYGNWCGASQH